MSLQTLAMLTSTVTTIIIIPPDPCLPGPSSTRPEQPPPLQTRLTPMMRPSEHRGFGVLDFTAVFVALILL